MSSAMRRIVCAVLLGMVVGNGLYGMPVPSGGIVARPMAIVAGIGNGPVAKAGGAITPEARDNMRWAGLSITVYCLLTHRLGM